MRKAGRDPANLRNRPLDVRFAIDQLESVGMAGYSFGAYTTLAGAGQTFFTAAGKQIRLAEPRLKATVAMSPNAPARKLDEGAHHGRAGC